MDMNHGQTAGGSCVVKYDAGCVDCKAKVLEIMSSVRGHNYDVIIDGERGVVSINAEVDPNMFVSAINLDAGVHGKLVQARITKVDRKNEVNYGCTHNNHVGHHHHNHALIEGVHAAALGHPAGDRVVIYPNGFEGHPRGCNNSCCRPTPPAVHVPSYPPQWPYDGYPDQYGSSFCSIM